MRFKAHWGYDDEFMETFRPELTILPEHIELDHVAVIERGGRMVGYVHLRPERDEILELVSLFIDTWAIRQGFGQQLWSYAIAYAREHGYRRVTLEADPTPSRSTGSRAPLSQVLGNPRSCPVAFSTS